MKTGKTESPRVPGPEAKQTGRNGRPPCPDCGFCQLCSESRCRMCNQGREKPPKLCLADQIALYNKRNEHLF